jgi:hypothetical protein
LEFLKIKIDHIIMYVGSMYKFLHKFRSPAESAIIEIAIAIKNGQSLKLCQMQQVEVFAFVASHLINTKHEAFGPLPDPLMGLKEGTGEERGLGRE